MKKLFILTFFACVLTITCNKTPQKNKSNLFINKLRDGFLNPPLEARPRALWAWVDGNFSLDEITNEMEEAVAKGVGGFDIWDVQKVVDENNVVPAGPAFMSDKYLEGIVHAINEAERLNLDLGLVVASGWNAGGSWTKPRHQTMGFFHSQKIVKGPKTINVKLDFPVLPDKVGKPGEEQTPIIHLNENGLPKYYSEIKVIAIPVVKNSKVIKKSMVLDISDKMDVKGNLVWDAPEGEWIIKRYVCTNTGQPMISSTTNSGGPMIDHFNPKATEEHIKFFINKIEDKLGKPIGQSGLSYLYTDSYEVVGLLWTEKLLEEFEKRMHYSMVPYLPVFEGYTLENKNITKRFLYDYRKVWSDLIIDSHYKKATEICENNGIGFVAEAAGPGMPVHNCPFESLKSSGALSFPRGEFWHISDKNEYFRNTDEKTRNHFLNELQVIKGVASASHIYNQKYVEAEAFTGLNIWTEGPGDLKATADRAFCEGLNRIIFHTWPHTPKEAGKPGWAYSFGTLINETRVWWPMAKPWMDYLGRNSFMLQQGNFVGDLLYYYGDSVPNFAPAKHINPSLGYGYDYDVTNTDIIINKLNVKDGKLVLPHGQEYQVLVLPKERYMNYEVLKKIEYLVKSGATVVGPKPLESCGLKDWKQNKSKVIELANKIWGKCDGKHITENNYGKGKVVWGKSLKQIMKEKNVDPDFEFFGNVETTKIDFIHRKVKDAEIYFISNTSNQKIFGNAIFRVSGKQPEMWSPVAGNIIKSNIFSEEKGKTILPFNLEAKGSVFVVFNSNNNEKHINKIIKDEKVIFPIKEANKNSTQFFSENQIKNNSLLFYESGKYILYKTDGKSKIINIEKKISELELKGEWQVNFPKKSKGVGNVTFKNLQSWTKSNEFDIKFFSGMATYQKEFSIPLNYRLNELSVILDLGTVFDVAHIYINGKDAGISWVKPNKIDVSNLVKTGKNTIRVEVANTWHNRLCGDAKLPLNDRITKSNITRLPNPWANLMEDIPLDKKSGKYNLQESGLIGPVVIKFIRNAKIK